MVIGEESVAIVVELVGEFIVILSAGEGDGEADTLAEGDILKEVEALGD